MVPEVKSTYIMKGNLINGSMMNVEKVQTDCRRSAFLLLVRTLADAVAVWVGEDSFGGVVSLLNGSIAVG